MILARTLVLLLLLAPLGARADSPPPWASCSGLTAGAACDLYPAGTGNCVVQPDCTDPVESAENECLWCEGTPDSPDDGGFGCSTGGALGGLAIAAASVLRRTARRAHRGA
jgi:hypothetical protein